jgi:hypothetical protein
MWIEDKPQSDKSHQITNRQDRSHRNQNCQNQLAGKPKDKRTRHKLSNNEPCVRQVVA